ncbi:hypothetical protein, partial [Actinocorallia lasiicapitis]
AGKARPRTPRRPESRARPATGAAGLPADDEVTGGRRALGDEPAREMIGGVSAVIFREPAVTPCHGGPCRFMPDVRFVGRMVTRRQRGCLDVSVF